MKHIFIINPAAGQGKAPAFLDGLKKLRKSTGLDLDIYETRSAGDGERFAASLARKLMEQNAGAEEPLVRLYAVGGDGTFNEVLNGAVGSPLIEVGIIPFGTGNDFIRNFGTDEVFMNLEAQVKGCSVPCDLIHYEGLVEGRSVSRYCANMVNIGFDCNVVDLTARMKKVPLLVGPTAYMASVGVMFVSKKGENLKITVDGELAYDGPLLLTAVANGCFCGGGVKGLPLSNTSDGLLDVSIIRMLSRRKFLQLFPSYAKGTHLDNEKAAPCFIYKQAKEVVIEPNREQMKLCVDGEISMSGPISFRIVPQAFRFIVPEGAAAPEV